jgi:NRPS condensation-like uncharacterized protein
MKDFCRVEPFDLMQYFYRSAHDPIIHAVVHTEGRIDPNLLGNAFLLSCQTVPVIGCSFSVTGKRPRWNAQEFSGKAFVQLVQPETDEETAEEQFLTSTIDITAGPQVKAGVIRKRDRDTLCVLINHMVCDGGGFKEYLYLVCSLYNNLSKGEGIDIPSPIIRSIWPVFSTFSLFERVRLSLPPWNIPSPAHQDGYALLGDDTRPFICVRRIGLNAVKQSAKENGTTINDMLLAAYARVLCRNLEREDILIPCPVDLGKYLPEGIQRGICNLTSNYMCSLHVEKDDPFETTLRQVSAQMNRQKESNGCLKPVRLLSALFRLLPFHTLQNTFKRAFTIPVISYTNLGILDENRLCFHNAAVTGAFLTGAIKYVPYFQIAVSTFRDTMTLVATYMVLQKIILA